MRTNWSRINAGKLSSMMMKAAISNNVAAAAGRR